MGRLRRNIHQINAEPKEEGPKRKSHGPRKGGSFEREICKSLSYWWSNEERDDIFWRTAGSGARATVRSKKGKDTANSSGDISALDPIGEPFIQFFFSEIKRGYPKGFDLIGMLDRHKSYNTPQQKKNTIYGWWEKLLKESKETKRRPLLIFKRDKGADCICIDGFLFFEFQAHFGFFPTEKVIHYKFGIYDFVMITLSAFYNWIHPDGIKELIANGQNQVPEL